jgi:tetratricopeptide (TPR) repeat protein
MSEISEHLDAQQAKLVERLRAARGAPVTFEELRGIGIENPALLCYELAAVGLPITRTSSPGEGMPALSVRLEHELDDPAPDEHPLDAPGAVPETGAPLAQLRRTALAAAAPVLLEGARAGAARLARSLRPPVGRTAALAVQLRRSAPRPRMGSLEPRALAALASLIAVFVVAIAIAFGELAHRRPPSAGPARGPAQHLPEASRNGPPAQGAAAPRRPQPAPPASAVVAAAAGAQLASGDAVSLESEGHQLLAEGSYTRAIGTLASAVRESGESPSRCSEPASEACLTLAYALYDLGRALRLEGRQAEAIAVLSERLSIDNQRATVQHEIDLARGAPA